MAPEEINLILLLLDYKKCSNRENAFTNGSSTIMLSPFREKEAFYFFPSRPGESNKGRRYFTDSADFYTFIEKYNKNE